MRQRGAIGAPRVWPRRRTLRPLGRWPMKTRDRLPSSNRESQCRDLSGTDSRLNSIRPRPHPRKPESWISRRHSGARPPRRDRIPPSPPGYARRRSVPPLFASIPRRRREVAAAIVLQKFDRATHHVWKARLFAARFDLVCKRQLAGTEHAQNSFGRRQSGMASSSAFERTRSKPFRRISRSRSRPSFRLPSFASGKNSRAPPPSTRSISAPSANCRAISAVPAWNPSVWA